MKKLYVLFLIIGTVSLVTGLYYNNLYQKFLEKPVFKQSTEINIEKGLSFQGFSAYLISIEATGKSWQWRLFARFEKVAPWLKAGEFEIDASLTPMQMMKKINANEVITYQFTIVEGMNWRELKSKLLADNTLEHALSDMDDAQLLQKLNSDKAIPEGLFLPETYQFVRGDSDLDVLKRAHDSLQKGLQEHWHNKKQNLPYADAYQLLTMASIVEKETSLSHERGTIAGVFVRRLQSNMRLQTDPTVIYGMGLNYDGDIKSKDLKTDTPYNTYTRKGLPPTPIAMASIESILASAHPVDGRSLYFVANNRGGHYFSETYSEHQKAVKGYLQGKKL